MTTNNTVTAIKETLGFNSFMPMEDVGAMLKADASAAFMALVEVMARQTQDERVNKGTSHKNRFGFSKKHVTRGTELAQKYLAEEPLTSDDVSDACVIAHAYRQQIWMVCLGAVPVNNLDLRRQG